MAFDKYQYDQQYLKQNMITKRVPFNRTKEVDMALLRWAEAQGNFTQYIKGLIIDDIRRRGGTEMIIQNPLTDNPVIVTNAAGTQVAFDVAVVFMDDDLREQLHDDLDPCTEQEFFSAYEKAHLETFGEEWELSKANPVY